MELQHSVFVGPARISLSASRERDRGEGGGVLRCALLKKELATLCNYSKTLGRPLSHSSATFLVYLGNK